MNKSIPQHTYGFWRRGLCHSCAPLRNMAQSFDVAIPSYNRNICVECGSVCTHPIEDFVFLPNPAHLSEYRVMPAKTWHAELGRNADLTKLINEP